MFKINETTSYDGTAPAGRWFAGDPCYAIQSESDDAWQALLHQTDCFEGRPDGVLPDGRAVIAFGTAHGDGTYIGVGRYGTENVEFDVDAGVLGLVQARDGEKCPDGMVEISSERPVRFSAKDGVIVLGPYTINTDD